MKTVKTKIVILGIICAFVSACVCGSVSLMRTQAITNQNAEQIMSIQCENSGQEINATLVRVAQSVDTLTQIAEQTLTNSKQTPNMLMTIQNLSGQSLWNLLIIRKEL